MGLDERNFSHQATAPAYSPLDNTLISVMAALTENPQLPNPVNGSQYGNNWRELFAQSKISDLLALKRRHLVTVSSRATVEQTIQVCENNTVN